MADDPPNDTTSAPGRGASADQPDQGVSTASDEQRQRTIDILCEAFADDELRVEEFERRVDAAHRATTAGELQELLTGLRAAVATTGRDEGDGGQTTVLSSATVTPAVAGRNATVRVDEVRSWGLSAGILGASNRRGHWTAARRNVVVGVMGGCTLDFRDAVMPPGVTDVQAFAFCGGVEVIVPPWMRVESSGIGLMGGFEHNHDAPQPMSDPLAPVLRVSGFALMGGVEVKVRLPGESNREAKRRLRERRRARRAVGKAKTPDRIEP